MSNISVRIHPVVVFNIVDIFERRNPETQRVIGTLLGNVDKLGNVEVTNSFVIKHREVNNEVAVDLEVAKELYELHRKVYTTEVIVGWFATGGGNIDEYSVVIHDYYSRECQNPIHLTVDPSETGVQTKCFVSTVFGVPGKSMGNMFTPIDDVTISYCYEPEMVGVRACMYASGFPTVTSENKNVYLDNELEQIVQMSSKCQESITKIVKFIDETILIQNQNAVIPQSSNDIGRQLMAMIENIIPFGEDDEAFNANLKDFLMVVYLSNLSKTEVVLNEKLAMLVNTAVSTTPTPAAIAAAAAAAQAAAAPAQ